MWSEQQHLKKKTVKLVNKEGNSLSDCVACKTNVFLHESANLEVINSF